MNKGACALLAMLLCPTAAEATDVSFLGQGREIPRGWSASRDAPAFNMILLPRSIKTAAGEFALTTARFEEVSLRVGFLGGLELEHDDLTSDAGGLIQGQGPMFWRGHYGFYAALSLDVLAEAWCEGCGLELGLSARHESEHLTASNHGDAPPDFSAAPQVGDNLILDVALRQRTGAWLFHERAQLKIFFPERSSYSVGPGLELHGRWTRWPAFHPFASLFVQYLAGTETDGRRYPDHYLARALLGGALPSSLGDILVYLSADVGHRMGLLATREEATIGLGVRLALGDSGQSR